MAGLYNRVNARGFPSSIVDGRYGVMSLNDQGTTVDPQHGLNVPAIGQQTLMGFEVEGAAPAVPVPVLEGMWGLPGGLNEDRTPGTHAAPVPGWAGSYDDPALLVVHENSAEIHSVDFGALTRRVHTDSHVEPTFEQWGYDLVGESVQQPIRGQLQAEGKNDDVQGYGLRNGYGFDGGHRNRQMNTTPQPMSFLDPAERLFIVPQASGSYTPTDDVYGPGPYWSGWDSTGTNATDPSPYAPPIEPSTNATPLTGGAVSAGWW